MPAEGVNRSVYLAASYRPRDSHRGSLACVDLWEAFEIIGPIRRIQTIASGDGIRDLVVLEERFGRGNWLKLKGFATVRIEDGTMHEAEIHWYEAEGIGMRWAKIKRYLE